MSYHYKNTLFAAADLSTRAKNGFLRHDSNYCYIWLSIDDDGNLASYSCEEEYPDSRMFGLPLHFITDARSGEEKISSLFCVIEHACELAYQYYRDGMDCSENSICIFTRDRAHTDINRFANSVYEQCAEYVTQRDEQVEALMQTLSETADRLSYLTRDASVD